MSYDRSHCGFLIVQPPFNVLQFDRGVLDETNKKGWLKGILGNRLN